MPRTPVSSRQRERPVQSAGGQSAVGVHDNVLNFNNVWPENE